MTDKITNVLETLTILEDLSTDTAALKIFINIIFLIISGVFLFSAVVLFVKRHEFDSQKVAIFAISITVIAALCFLYEGISELNYTNKHPKKIQILILTEDIDHIQIHKYFEVSDAKIDNEIIITPRSEYYEEALEWYTANYPIV